MQSPLILFAVKEEAAFFRGTSAATTCRQLITGMGRRNAERAIRVFLASEKPGLIITAGFAGALNPEFGLAAVIFDADSGIKLEQRLLGAGAIRGRFVCTDRVVVSATDKHALRKTTGADAVEMESSAIRAVCREFNLPSATVRVISDEADEDLPLDFNSLMTSDSRINYFKLAAQLATAPGKIPRLMKFQQRTKRAAKALATVLDISLRG